MEPNVTLPDPSTQAMALARGMKGWIKFLGVMNIIGGALNALSIVGILWAWLPIWIGAVMLQAGSRAEDYAARGDAASLSAFMDKLKSYFTISGIALIVSMALVLLWIILWIVLIAAGVFTAGSLLEYLNRYGNY